jgi:hypothetical protein
MVADTEEEADRDLEYLHEIEMQSGGLLDYQIICMEAPTLGTVAVVDPFSTGANLAAMVVKMGYKLLLVFSEVDSPVANLVASDATLNSKTSIYHDPRPPRSSTQALNDTGMILYGVMYCDKY